MLTREEKIANLEFKLDRLVADNKILEKDIARTVLNLEEQRMLKDIRDKKVLLIDSTSGEYLPVQVFKVD